MTDILPRFVGPDFVVMPEEICSLCKTPGGVWIVEWVGGECPLSCFRADRPTGMTDRNGKAIFERDRVTDDWNEVWTVVMDDGAWCVHDDDGRCEPLDPDGASIVEVADMVSYTEEGVNA